MRGFEELAENDFVFASCAGHQFGFSDFDGISVLVEKVRFENDVFRAVTVISYDRFKGKLSVGVIVYELGCDESVAQRLLRFGEKVNLAENSGEIPHILIFKIRACRIAVDDGSDLVVSYSEVFGDVELMRGERTL